MLARKRWIVVLVCLVLLIYQAASLVVAGSGPVKNESAKLEKIPGSDLVQITLQPKAAERLGIQTTQIDVAATTATPNAAALNQPAQPANTVTSNTVVPYSALLYDVDGGTWVYISPQPLVFVRHKIVVDHIDGNKVYLREGPSLGSAVVTIGVDELKGIEEGVAK